MKYFILCLVLALAAALSAVGYFMDQAEQNRLDKENYKKLYQNQIRRSRNAQQQERATAPVATLSEKEFREAIREEIKQIEKQWDVKYTNRRVLAKADFSISTKVNSRSIGRDSVIIHHWHADSAKSVRVFEAKDAYNHFYEVLIGDTLVRQVTIRNDVTGIAYRGKFEKWYYGLLPWKWGNRPIQADVYLYNPLSGLDTLQIKAKRINN